MKLPFNKSIVKYFSCFSVILMIIGIFACEKTDKYLLAVVSEKKITLEEFRLFYELDPNFGIDSTGINALRDELKKYIDRYVAKEKAEKDNLWEDPTYKKALDWEINQIQLRQLYREVVETPIRISEEEIREEFIKQSIQVNIRHLYSDNLDQATKWYKTLQRGESFENLAAESFTDTLLANNGGDLGWLSLSDFDDNLAREISLLSANEISKQGNFVIKCQ
jgi:parvulin-like peptidyl-prolyl isomerase